MLAELNDAERAWVASETAALTHAGVAIEAGALEACYDQAYADWIANGLASDPNVPINRLAIGVGQVLIEATGLRWVVATDEYGTELALHGEPGDFIAYPANALGKRWAEGATGFICGYIEMVVGAVQHARETLLPG